MTINKVSKSPSTNGSTKPLDKTVIKTDALKPTHNPSTQKETPELSTKKVTYSNPFSAFINFIRSILNFLTGKSKAEVVSEKPEPAVVKNAPIPVPKETSPIEERIPKSPSHTHSSEKPEPAVVKNAPIPVPKKTSLIEKRVPESTSHTHSKDIQATITKRYHNELLNTLKTAYSEQEATQIFNTIYPAFNAGLQKQLEVTVDLLELKKPLKVLARTLLLEFNVNTTLQQIAVKLAQGAVALNRQEIFKIYPDLEKALEKMPDQKKQFEFILSKAWITKTVKNLSEYQGSEFERFVLKKLGFDITSYDDKEFFKEALETLYNNNLPSLEEFPKEFKRQAFNLRARGAGVPEKALDNLRMLLTFYHQEKKKLVDQAEKIRDNLNIKSNSSSATILIKREFHIRNLELINQHLAKSLAQANMREKLSSNNFQQFLNSLPPLSKGLKSFKMLDGTLKEAADWFAKYEGMIVSEFSQGEDDDNECLGEGVCIGLSYRMASTALESPDAPIRKIAVRSIEPSDRIIQAYHSTRNEKTVSSALLPKEVLAKRKQKEKLVFVAKGDTNVGVGLIEHLPKLAESNGGIMLVWGDHATFMRFDPARNKFFFFDPNFNTMVFQRKPGESLEHLAIRMATAYVELYRWAYLERGLMTAYQIVPLKEGESMPTGKIDTSKIPIYTD
jgi:hypothetical protein